MRRGFKPLALLMLLAGALLAPLVLGCVAASVAVPDPAPLQAESEDDEDEGKKPGG